MMKKFFLGGVVAGVLLFCGTVSVEAATCSLTPGKAYKTSYSPATYYVTENCTKQLLNQDQFFSYFESWNDIVVSNRISYISTDAAPASFGPSYYPRTGSVVKTPDDPTVYYILWFAKNKITSPEVFEAMGLKWEWIETVPQATLDKFTEGETLDSTDKVFNEGLYFFSYFDTPHKIHLLLPDLRLGGVNRHYLKNENLIDYIGYRRDRIPTLHPVYQFPLGQPIDDLEAFFTQYLSDAFAGFWNEFDDSAFLPPEDLWTDDFVFEEDVSDDVFFDSWEEVEPNVSGVRPVDVAFDHIFGDLNAPITIIEYVDLQCPYCQRFHSTLKEVVGEYPNDVRWVYRHFPLEQVYPQSRMDAMATECANDQGKFWEMVDALFAHSNVLDGLHTWELLEIGRGIGLDGATFKACLEQRPYEERINADIEDAVAAGALGVPHSLLIGPEGQVVPIHGAVLKSVITSEIEHLLR